MAKKIPPSKTTPSPQGWRRHRYYVIVHAVKRCINKYILLIFSDPSNWHGQLKLQDTGEGFVMHLGTRHRKGEKSRF